MSVEIKLVEFLSNTLLSLNAVITKAILGAMKTTISIPDSIFKAAESLASSLGVSRSELFTHAVAEFIETERCKYIISQLNKVYSNNQSTLSEDLATMQHKTVMI